MGIKVRPATYSDIDWVVPEIKKHMDFCGFKTHFYPGKEQIVKVVQAHIEEHVALVAECSVRGPIGFIAGIFFNNLFNPSIRTLTETAWWVSQNARGSRAALLLRDAFIEIGKEKVDWISIGLEAHSPVNERSLKKKGFKLQELKFVLEVNHG